MPLPVAACHWSYLLILSKHVLRCPVLGAVVIDMGLTSDTAPLQPSECLTSDGRRAEDSSFPNVLTEDGSSRNQTWHLLHVALGPRAVSCSSMEQTCLLLHCLVCGEQQTPGRGGDRHRYRFVIIKHQEPGVRAWARSGGVLICTIPSMLPANFQCPLPPLPPAHKG